MNTKTLWIVGLTTAVLGSLIAFGIVYLAGRKKLEDEYNNSAAGKIGKLFNNF